MVNDSDSSVFAFEKDVLRLSCGYALQSGRGLKEKVFIMS